MEQGEANKWYTWFGRACGSLYKTGQEWEKAPEYMRASYRLEVENRSGDIDTPLSGAAKGLFEGGKEYFKQNPADAIEMGKNIADILKIKPEQGIAFATEFMKTAFLK